jgi:hypothetical protein
VSCSCASRCSTTNSTSSRDGNFHGLESAALRGRGDAHPGVFNGFEGVFKVSVHGASLAGRADFSWALTAARRFDQPCLFWRPGSLCPDGVKGLSGSRRLAARLSEALLRRGYMHHCINHPWLTTKDCPVSAAVGNAARNRMVWAMS